MTATPLYLGDALAPNSLEAAVMLVQIVQAIVGIGIAYIAYRGYRRNESRPMLYIAIGFILVLGVPFALYIGAFAAIAATGLASDMQLLVVGIAEISQLLGLVAIWHALRV